MKQNSLNIYKFNFPKQFDGQPQVDRKKKTKKEPNVKKKKKKKEWKASDTKKKKMETLHVSPYPTYHDQSIHDFLCYFQNYDSEH